MTEASWLESTTSLSSRSPHRLNALGYLWLAGLPGVSERFLRTANLPLADLVLALEWVRDNIAQFGGSPANVTIFGQSGGGGKVAMLTAFPAAKGLFHRAIIMSTLADTAVTGLAPARAVEAAELLLGRLGVKASDCRQTAPNAGRADCCGTDRGGPCRRARRPDRDRRHLTTFRAGGRWPYAARAPIRAFRIGTLGDDSTDGWLERVRGDPYANADDPYWTREPANVSELRSEVKRIVPVNDADADRLIALYRSHRPAESLGDIAAVMAGDASSLRHAGHLIARRKHMQGRAPVFLYAFTWRSPVRQGKLRSMHGMELPFVFDHPDAIFVHDGDGQGSRGTGDGDEPSVGRVRSQRKPQPRGHSVVDAVRASELANDGVRPSGRAAQRPAR
jgi:para-nitrobenzyl esterase